MGKVFVTPVDQEKELLSAKAITEEEKSIKVAVCDSCAPVRAGLRYIFSTTPGIDLALQEISIIDVLRHTDTLDLDVMLLEIDDDLGTDYYYLDQFRELSPKTRLMAFTNCHDLQRILDVIEHGIKGLQIKANASARKIIEGVISLHGGHENLPDSISGALLACRHPAEPSLRKSLSARELEVLNLVSKGKTNCDIAENLYISVRTVKCHVSAILTKLKVKNRTEAASILKTFADTTIEIS